MFLWTIYQQEEEIKIYQDWKINCIQVNSRYRGRNSLNEFKNKCRV